MNDISAFSPCGLPDCPSRPQRRPPGPSLLELMDGVSPDAQLLFVGSLNCIRHKPYSDFGGLMQSGRAAFLCPTMSDFSTGRYLHQVEDAILELSRERNTQTFILTFGCQWVILSTDADLMKERLKTQHGIDLLIRDDSHLENGDHP